MKKTVLALILILLILSIPISACAYTITYTYDELDRLTSVTYDNGQAISYTYDPGGNLLSASHTDNNPLKIVTTDPADGATNVPVDKHVYAAFNREIKPGSDITSIAIKSGETVVSYAYSIDKTKLLILPTGILAPSVTYSVYIPKRAVEDTSGATLAGDYSFSFTTQAEPSFPQVTSTDPADGAVNTSVYQSVYVTFNQEIQPGDSFSGITLKTGDTVISTVYSINTTTLTLTPTAPLAPGTPYSVHIPARAVQGPSGNTLANPYSFSFTTQTDQAVPVLATLTLSGSPHLTYSGAPVTFDLTTLTLEGRDQISNPYDLTGQTVTWTVYSNNATVTGSALTINGAGQVSITATIGMITSNTLALSVTQASPTSNADLSSLTVSRGTLVPAFTPSATAYTVSVAKGTKNITVTPTAADPKASIQVNGTPVASGQPSQTIRLTPRATTTITIQVTAQDGATKTYTVAVRENIRPINIRPVALQSAQAGRPYSRNITASGGTAPYTFCITAGALPGGLTLDLGGSLYGAPAQAGSFTFTVTATDANGFTGARSYTLKVRR